MPLLFEQNGIKYESQVRVYCDKTDLALNIFDKMEKIMSIYDSLNDKQKEAVLQTKEQIHILAVAGSRNTRLITHTSA